MTHELENRFKENEARYKADLTKRSEEVEVCRDNFNKQEKEDTHTI